MNKADKQKRPPKAKAAGKAAPAKNAAASSDKTKAAETAAKPAKPPAKAPRTAATAAKPKGKAVSQTDALRAENAELKTKLAAAESRIEHLLMLTRDVTAKLDDAIALIRGLVKH